MGTIVAFKPGRRLPTRPPDGADAEILWFTGVRYIRIESCEIASAPKPVARRTKRLSTRRPRPSIVSA
jgi:hypothetical protein